jgi:hypothetical protein
MKRLPNSQRTWIPFKSGAYSGANMFLLSGKTVLPALETWRSIEQDRKKAWALLWALGPMTFIGAALRLLTIHQTLDRIGRRLGVTIEAVDLSDPRAAVDVDKLADHGLVEQLLKERAGV